VGRRRDREAVARRLHAAPPRPGRGPGAPRARGLHPLTGFFAELRQAADRAPDRLALCWDGGALRYGELFARAQALGDGLRAAGLQPGECVALLLGNTPEFAVALLAGLQLGATVVPLDVLLAADERQAVLEHLKPALVVDAAGIGARRPGARRADAPRAPALVLYTSGSTGRPKGALLSHAAVSFANRSWAGPVLALQPDDAVLGALPLAHSFGLNAGLLAPLLAGASIRLLERFSPEKLAGLVADGQLTVVPGVATMFRRLLDLPSFARAGRGRLRLAVAGAAPCPWPLALEWRARTGVRIVRGYGSTELHRPISCRADEDADREGTIGRALPGVELRIVDGELWVRTPGAMDGYLDAPEETARALADGWFRTGDLASQDEQGHVTITGRQDERILRAGYSVFPAEVEAVLVDHPAVREAAVLGSPHPELGEEVAAFVALRPGARADPAELVAYCRERLAAFKYPRRITIVPALPRSAAGKLLKAELARLPIAP
jgi:long-chain acyl-CoA synthetase